MSVSRLHILGLAALVIVALLACRQSSNKSGASASANAPPAAADPVDAAATPEAQKARVTKKVATLEAIAKQKLPPISAKRTLKAAPPKPTLDGFVNSPNAALASLEQLAELRVDKQLPSFVTTSLSWCGAWISGKKASIDERYIRECDGFRYVVVLRFSRLIKPKMTGASTYRPGNCAGDATVFDIETGERLGSVPFSAANAGELEAMQGVEQGRVESDLNRRCAWAAQVEIDEIFGDPTPK